MSINFKKYAPKKGHVLCLKSLQANLIASHNDFQWPSKGKCIAPDWKPTTACGNGLHAFLWGAGDGDLRCKDEDAKWLVMSVDASTIIDLDSKVKFPECEVVFCGDRETAIAIILHFAPSGTPVMFGTVTGGDRATVTGGDAATVTGGNRATVTGGYAATVTGGYAATVTGGDAATVTAGLYGFLILEYKDQEKDLWLKKMAFVDNVTILKGVKYRLNASNEFEAVNDSEA